MANDRPARLLRNPDVPRQASLLELFFDLAFIVGLTLLSARLVRELEWLNALQCLVLLAGMWWIWIATAWSTDWYNPSEPFIQRLVLCVMFASLLMSSAVTGAFGPLGFVFAGSYAAVHLGRGLVLTWALRGHPLQRRTIVVLIWFAVSGTVWLAGAAVSSGPRLGLWIVAILIDYVIAWFGWPTPRLGRITPKMLRTVGEHLSERYRQVFIIALGEIILVTGLRYGGAPFASTRTLAFALAFLTAVLMWWIYLEPGVTRLGSAIDENLPRTAVSLAYCHLFMIAGSVATAVGNELIISKPGADTDQASTAVIVGAAVLFLLGRNLMDLVLYRRFSWPRLAGMLVLLAVSPAMLHIPPMPVSAITNVVLFFVGLTERIERLRQTGKFHRHAR